MPDSFQLSPPIRIPVAFNHGPLITAFRFRRAYTAYWFRQAENTVFWWRTSQRHAGAKL